MPPAERWISDETGRCPSQRAEVPVPKIVDLADGVVTYDPAQARKRPDWTYEPLD